MIRWYAPAAHRSIVNSPMVVRDARMHRRRSRYSLRTSAISSPRDTTPSFAKIAAI